jgi:hypothetical protein
VILRRDRGLADLSFDDEPQRIADHFRKRFSDGHLEHAIRASEGEELIPPGERLRDEGGDIGLTDQLPRLIAHSGASTA